MSKVGQKLACEIILKQPDTELVHHIPDYLSSKSEPVRDTLLGIVADHATEKIYRFSRPVQ